MYVSRKAASFKFVLHGVFIHEVTNTALRGHNTPCALVKPELVVSTLPRPRLDANASPLERNIFTLIWNSQNLQIIQFSFFFFLVVNEKATTNNIFSREFWLLCKHILLFTEYRTCRCERQHW